MSDVSSISGEREEGEEGEGKKEDKQMATGISWNWNRMLYYIMTT